MLPGADDDWDWLIKTSHSTVYIGQMKCWCLYCAADPSVYEPTLECVLYSADKQCRAKDPFQYNELSPTQSPVNNLTHTKKIPF
ncbi:hypothetical protein XELAEV_18003018mg [Xenopus laevis]|uniref:Uncharacterized protein n=1 Tax=Xenopus laevis TaxID=8355 RepID=A0A974BNK4_XENLA|nr:hypothetical protein XELAEV_18003018mg [Xenopus laevis]